MEKYYKVEVREYDVWGNDKDGYEVNDCYLVMDDLMVSEEIMTSIKQLKRLCKKLFNMKRNIHLSSITLDGDSTTIYCEYKGIPVGVLSIVETAQ